MVGNKLRWSYSEAKKHAKAIHDSRSAKMRETARQAGIDPTMPGCHAHNALVSLHYGHPWPNVDYSLVRKVKWLEDHLFDGYRILDRYARRRDLEDRFWISSDQGKFA